MNKIEKIIETLNDYGIIKDLDSLKYTLVNTAYRKRRFADLVNIKNINLNILYIGDLTYGKDYDIKTGRYYSKLLSQYYYTKDIYKSDIEEYLKKYNLTISDLSESWDNLDYEEDEIYYNYVYNFNNIDIDIQNAYLSNLGVINIFSQDNTYLFLKGCGMDFSYKLMEYLCRTYKCLSYDFATEEKIELLRENVGHETFIELMGMLGLDKNKLTIGELNYDKRKRTYGKNS